MSVRCKFRCAAITDIPVDGGPSTTKQVVFNTEWDPTIPEDERFTKATPWGNLDIYIDNPAAIAELEVGKFYYLDLTPVV